MRYHGNYCGPNWSAGKHQGSVVDPDVPAVDEFDSTCLLHDAAYATSADLYKADMDFFKQNIFQGAKRSVAAVLVGTQGVGRGLVGAHINMTKKLRGSTKPKAAPKKGATLSTVPASYGFSLRMTPPKVVRSGDRATISGADCAGSVNAVNTASYQPAASVLLNPAYFQNGMLGSLARAYEKFRFVKAVVRYIPSVPTSTQGQIVMISTRTVKEPFLNGASTTFLSRALSQGNAVASPLWKEETLEVPCSGDWSIVDSLIDGDLDDCIQEEVQVYTTCDSTVSCGILMLHYVIEFKDPLYTYHPTLIPLPVGNGSFNTLIDNSAVNAGNDAIRLTNSFGPSLAGNGAVFRMVFRQEVSTLPTGIGSWPALAAIECNGAATSTTVTIIAANIAMSTGTTLYGLANGNDIVLYASYEGATNGALNDVLVYQSATTAVGSYSFITSMVRMPQASRINNQ